MASGNSLYYLRILVGAGSYKLVVVGLLSKGEGAEVEDDGMRERTRSRRLVIIVLLACTTYTVQSTQEPDTHFSHLGLNTFGL